MRSSCFNFLCCFLIVPLPPPLPFPVPSPPTFSSFFLSSYFGETAFYPIHITAAFLTIVHTSLHRTSGHVMVLCFFYLYSRVSVCYARSLAHFHAPSSIYLSRGLCFEHTDPLSLCVWSTSAHFLFSHRVSFSLACNSLLSLHNPQ